MIEIVNKLKNLEPISIFTYGSYATCTQNAKSDIEIGVVFDDKHFVTSQEIIKVVNNPLYSVFSFKEKELLNYSIDTPFDKNIYISSLANGNAKTIYGKKIVENLTPPRITKQNLLNDTYFNLGYALGAYRIYKAQNLELSCEMLYKSMLFATRNLIYLKTKNLVSGYNSIYAIAKKLKLAKKYDTLLDLSYNLRNNAEKTNVDADAFIENITYINKFVIESIKNSDI